MFWRKDGTSFPAEYWSHPQWKDGIAVGAVVTFVDISERKQAEARQAASLRHMTGLNSLREDLLLPQPLEEKLKRITDAAVDLLDLDFCRIWRAQPGDLCKRLHPRLGDRRRLRLCLARNACILWQVPDAIRTSTAATAACLSAPTRSAASPPASARSS